MKRDMDLVRKILLEVGSWSWSQRNDPLKVGGYTDEEVAYHVKMMHDAGLSVAETAETLGVSPRTVDSVWRLAKAWLHRELS